MKFILLFSIVLLSCYLTPTFAASIEIPGLMGLHYDIEPHATSQWDSGWSSVATQFLTLLQQLQPIAADAGLLLSLDMNADYDGAQCGGSCALSFGGSTKQLSDHCIDLVDRTILMAYSNNGTLAVEHSSHEVAYADSLSPSLHKRTLIGANLKFNDIPSEKYPSLAAMETGLSIAYQAFSAGPSFSRFAVHTYGYYVESSPPLVLEGTPAQAREVYWWCNAQSLCDVYSQSDQDALISFAKAHAIVVVYIDAPAIVNLAASFTDCSEDLLTLSTFIRKLNDNGIASELIFGAANWALTANHHIPLTYANNAVKFVQLCGDQVSGSSSTASTTAHASTTNSGQSSTSTSHTNGQSTTAAHTTHTTTRTITSDAASHFFIGFFTLILLIIQIII